MVQWSSRFLAALPFATAGEGGRGRGARAGVRHLIQSCVGARAVNFEPEFIPTPSAHLFQGMMSTVDLNKGLLFAMENQSVFQELPTKTRRWYVELSGAG